METMKPQMIQGENFWELQDIQNACLIPDKIELTDHVIAKVEDEEYIPLLATKQLGFICEYCSTSFTEKTNLLRHQKSLHFSTKYKCNKCEFSTTRKDKLREHKFSKH